MALLALTGSFLIAGGPTATAATTTAGAAASAPAPSKAEGHSPQLNQKLSGPLSGTGLARPGSATRVSGTMRQATAAAASTAVNGIDVSSSQHPNKQNSDINWTSVAGDTAHYQFAAIKAAEDSTYTNPYYTYDAQQAVSNGMYVLPYEFGDPYNTSTTNNGTAQQQADYAVLQAAKAESASATTYTVGGKYLPLALDIEYDPYATLHNVDECYGLSASAMVTWITDFANEVKAKTGVEPIIYTTQDWWHTCTADSTAFGNDMLWVASYSSGTPGTLPAGWSNWDLWQYSSSGTVSGISGSTDLDYFSGAPETEQTAAGTAVTPIQIHTLNALAGQSVTYTATGLPPGTSISSSGQITGTPTAAGTYTVTVTPSAATAVVPSSVSFSWTVTPGAVTVTSPGNQTATAGSAVDVQVQASDSASGYTPTFQATGLPPGTSISSSGLITGWPNQDGTYTTTVTATDSAGATASTSFTWTINGDAAGPAGQLVLANGGKCLDDPASNTANGTRLDIWTCENVSNEKWTMGQDGTIRVFGKCLEVQSAGTTNGSVVDLNTCTASSSQRWRIGTDAQLINSHSGKCLDDPGAKTANGTQLDIWTCENATNERWTAPAGPAMSGIPGRCLDDKGASTTDGNVIDLYTCNGAAYENWSVMSDGTVRISGKCLDVKSGGTASGTLVDLYTCNGSGGQTWTVSLTSDMGGELINPQSGMCLADPGDTTANGVQLEIMTCSAADPGQAWHLR